MRTLLTLTVLASIVLFGLSDVNAQGKAQVIELEDEIIKGRIQKPEAFYILQHADLNYQRLDPKETFIPELIDSVKEKPFK